MIDQKKFMTRSFWYLAGPFTGHKGGFETAELEHAAALAAFVRAGVPVFSPIAMTARAGRLARLRPDDHKVWIPFDTPFMTAADGLIVVQLEGWRESYGVAVEIEVFKACGKPIKYVTLEDIGADRFLSVRPSGIDR